MEVIAAAQPDVITFQELDRISEARRDLAKLGYECSTQPQRTYTPAHAVASASRSLPSSAGKASKHVPSLGSRSHVPASP